MKNALNIVRKELDKIFRNPRLIFSTFIFPGLIIFLIYSLMGNTFSNEMSEANEMKSVVYVINRPEELLDQTIMACGGYEKEGLNIEIVDYEENIIDENKVTEFSSNIETETVQAYLYFEEDFVNKIKSYVDKETDTLPLVKYYINSTINTSSATESKLQMIIETMKATKVNEYYGNTLVLSSERIELADESSLSGQILGMLLPMLIMIFVFAGGLAVGADAIAGEKERGTIATILMAPVRKEEIVIGKMISTCIITILSALGSFIGVAAALPNMADLYGGASFAGYGAQTYIQLLILILLVAMMASCLFLTASTLGKTNKEASAYALPFYILSMVLGMSTMFMDKMPTNIGVYFIPLYNLVLGIKGVFIQSLTWSHMSIIVGSTVLYFIIIILIMGRLFKSERLMFAK